MIAHFDRGSGTSHLQRPGRAVFITRPVRQAQSARNDRCELVLSTRRRLMTRRSPGLPRLLQ